MRYIVERASGGDAYLLQIQDDGTFRKIGNVWKIEDAIEIVRLANAGTNLGGTSYADVHG